MASVKLYIVSTPIGNLNDITIRAVQVLQGADLIICENVIHSQNLLKHYQIKAKLTSYNDKSDAKMRSKILKNIEELEGYACLISDAGTPLISDPGYKLIADAHQQNIEVSTIPGPSAAIAALTLSALPTDRFIFLGFLGNTEKKRRATLRDLKNQNMTAVIYETGKGMSKLLNQISEELPDVTVSVSRELTKLYEETVHGTVDQVRTQLESSKYKGEFVLCIGPIFDELEDEQLFDLYRDYSALGVKTLTKLIVSHSSVSRNLAYKVALRILGELGGCS